MATLVPKLRLPQVQDCPNICPEQVNSSTWERPSHVATSSIYSICHDCCWTIPVMRATHGPDTATVPAILAFSGSDTQHADASCTRNSCLAAGGSGPQKALPVLRVYSEALLMSISCMQAENRNVASEYGDQRGPACPAKTVCRPSCFSRCWWCFQQYSLLSVAGTRRARCSKAQAQAGLARGCAAQATARSGGMGTWSARAALSCASSAGSGHRHAGGAGSAMPGPKVSSKNKVRLLWLVMSTSWLFMGWILVGERLVPAEPKGLFPSFKGSSVGMVHDGL